MYHCLRLKISVFILISFIAFSSFSKGTSTSVVIEQTKDEPGGLTKKLVIQQFVAKSSADGAYQLANFVNEAMSNPKYTYVPFGSNPHQYDDVMENLTDVGQLADTGINYLAGSLVKNGLGLPVKLGQEIVKIEHEKTQHNTEKRYNNSAPDATERQSLIIMAIQMGQNNPEIRAGLNAIFQKEMGYDLNSSQEKILSKAPELAIYSAVSSNKDSIDNLKTAMQGLDEKLSQVQEEAKKRQEQVDEQTQIQETKRLFDNARLLQHNLATIAGQFNPEFAQKFNVISSTTIDMVETAHALSGIKDFSQMFTLGNLASLSTGVGAAINLINFFSKQAPPSEAEIILGEMGKHFQQLNERIDFLDKHIERVHESILGALNAIFKSLSELAQSNHAVAMANLQIIENDLQEILTELDYLSKNQRDQMRGQIIDLRNGEMKAVRQYKDDLKYKNKKISLQELEACLKECRTQGCQTVGPFVLNEAYVVERRNNEFYQYIFNIFDFFLDPYDPKSKKAAYQVPFSDSMNILMELLFHNRYPAIPKDRLDELSNPQIWAESTQVAMEKFENCLSGKENQHTQFCNSTSVEDLDSLEKKGRLIQNLMNSIFYDVNFKTGEKERINLTVLKAHFENYAEKLLAVESYIKSQVSPFMEKKGYPRDVNILTTVDKQEFFIPTPIQVHIEHNDIAQLSTFLEKMIPKVFLTAAKLNLGKLDINFSQPQWALSRLGHGPSGDEDCAQLMGHLVFDISIDFIDGVFPPPNHKIELASFSIRSPLEEMFMQRCFTSSYDGGTATIRRSQPIFEEYQQRPNFITEVISQIEKTLNGSENDWIAQLLKDTEYARQHDGLDPLYKNLYEHHSAFTNFDFKGRRFSLDGFFHHVIKQTDRDALSDLALNFLTLSPEKTLIQWPMQGTSTLTKTVNDITQINAEAQSLVDQLNAHLATLHKGFQEFLQKDMLSITDEEKKADEKKIDGIKLDGIKIAGIKLDGQKLLLNGMIHVGLYRSSREDDVLKLFFKSPVQSAQILDSQLALYYTKNLKEEGLKRLQTLACYLAGIEEGKNLIRQFRDLDSSHACEDVAEFTTEGILKDRIHDIQTPELIEDVLASANELNQKIYTFDAKKDDGLLAKIRNWVSFWKVKS